MSRNARNFFSWMAVIATIILLIGSGSLIQHDSDESHISFSQLIADANNGRIRSVLISGDSVSGYIAGGNAFKTYAPKDMSYISTLLKDNVSVEIESSIDSNKWIRTLFLASGTPLIGVLAFWAYMVRKDRPFLAESVDQQIAANGIMKLHYLTIKRLTTLLEYYLTTKGLSIPAGENTDFPPIDGATGNYDPLVVDARYPNGDIYSGGLIEGKRGGNGKLIMASGDTYEGAFKNDLYHGAGTLRLKNGDKFVGEFLNGQINGKGVAELANGEKYVGEFKDGLYDGSGILTLPNGQAKIGMWSKGQYQDNQAG